MLQECRVHVAFTESDAQGVVTVTPYTVIFQYGLHERIAGTRRRRAAWRTAAAALVLRDAFRALGFAQAAWRFTVDDADTAHEYDAGSNDTQDPQGTLAAVNYIAHES